MILCALLNVVLALPSLRVAGDYFVVTSFGCQLVATAIFINWSQLTGGASGLVGIPTPSSSSATRPTSSLRSSCLDGESPGCSLRSDSGC